jgi:hypothetical protein
VLFPEGSAVQSCRLLGRTLGHVRVVLRRPGDRIAEHGLRPRARSLEYWDGLVGVVCGLDSDGEPFEVLGIPVLDMGWLVARLTDVLPAFAASWDEKAYRRHRDADVLEWLRRSLESPRVRGARSRQHMLASMKACELGHLVPAAQGLMLEYREPDAATSAG